jgi:uncharacterized membrane protein HdeD (DUF308 family)
MWRFRPYDSAMDRLDTWLSGLHGWRLAVLWWLTLSPGVLSFSLAIWNLFLPSPEPAVVSVEVGACATLATLPIAVLAAAVQDRLRDRRTARYSWRIILGSLLYLSAFTLGLLQQDVAGWQHYHRIIGAGSLLLLLAGIAFFVAGLFRMRRLRIGAADDALLPPR